MFIGDAADTTTFVSKKKVPMSRIKRFLREAFRQMLRLKLVGRGKKTVWNEGPDVAPDGQVWICQACSKRNKTRSKFSDTSCLTWSVLVYEKTIMMEDGVLITAEAVLDPEGEVGS